MWLIRISFKNWLSFYYPRRNNNRGKLHDALEKEMATHSSILAGKTEEDVLTEDGRAWQATARGATRVRHKSDTTHHHHHTMLILCQGPFWTPQVCNPSGACEVHTSIFLTVEETEVQGGCLASVSAVRGRMRNLDVSRVAPASASLTTLLYCLVEQIMFRSQRF